MSTVEYCGWSDLPIYECDHCPADARRAAEDALRDANRGSTGNDTTVIPKDPENATLRVVSLWSEVAPGGERPALHLKASDGETCACGLPLRDNAIGCDDCVAEMERILGDTPWLVEQLELAVTGQRSRTGAGRDGAGLPWNDVAAETLDALRNELVGTVRILVEDHGLDWPADDLGAISRWLLTHVRLLAYDDAWTDTLRNLRSIEGSTLRIVDNPPPTVFLGQCGALVWQGSGDTLRIEECPGSVYAREGVEVGYCRECEKPYDVDVRRDQLERRLDDQLVTASEIARLSTYLGIEQPRERVRNLVQTWHRRKRITAVGTRDGAPTFRYGDVRGLLSLAYETREHDRV